MRTHGINVDYSRDLLLTDFALTLLEEYYMLPEEVSPQESFSRAAAAFSAGDKELAQRLYDYASKKWFMFASPVLSNAPAYGVKPLGLPISCYVSYVPDTLEGLINHTTELRWLAVKGGGVGGHWSDVRSSSDIAPSPIPFLKTVDSDMNAYRQGRVRRGSYAAYMDVSHPDIIEFLNIRVPTGGDVNRKCFTIHNAVNITDKFLDAARKGLDWDLIDPNDKTIRDTMPARALWQRILETRFRTGEPFIFHVDEANKHLPQPLKDKGLKIHGSNLCAEIVLPTSEDRTGVCCLSSLNLEYYDDWKDTSIVADLITMLDNILQHFITHAPSTLKRAKHSATMERSLGLGAMGFHSFLQKKSIPFGSIVAKGWNLKIFKQIKEQAEAQTRVLAVERGEYPDGIGTGRRNSHLLAIAPNANNSIILGTSPSVEPYKANAYTHRTRAGSFLVKNKYLEEVLGAMGMNTDAVWTDIITNEGSVQHLDFLDDKTKEVFRTAMELDQRWIVDLARDRQQYICQAQSINLFFPTNTDKSYVNEVHLRAFLPEGMGVPLKSLYYLRSSAGRTADKISHKVADSGCLGCEG